MFNPFTKSRRRKGGIFTGGGLFGLGRIISAGDPPVNTMPPVLSGSFFVGQTLTCSTGTWMGSPAPTFTYQWQNAGVDIGGATNSTYVLVAGDDGDLIRCVVTATNAAGAASANSNALIAILTSIWLDPTDSATVINTAGAVSAWNDKSGNSYNATQGTGVSQPVTGVGTINGLNSIQFDTSNDRLNFPAGSYSIFTGPYTIYCVGENVSVGNGGFVYIGINGAARTQFRKDFSDTVAQIGAGNGQTNYITYVSDTDAHIFQLTRSGASATFYRDAQTAAPISAANFTALEFYLGHATLSSGMKYGDFIVIPRAIAYGGDEDLQIRDYLSRWGV